MLFGVIGLLLASGGILYLLYLFENGDPFSEIVSMLGFIISCFLAVIGLHLLMVSISSFRT